MAALGACGLQPDGAPRDITPVEQPAAGTTTPEGVSPEVGTSARIFLIDSAAGTELPRLVVARRDAAATPQARLDAVLRGPSSTAEAERRLRSAIPPGTTLLATDLRANGLLIVDMSAELLAATDAVLADAVAQIVFTVSELDSVREVQILVDGRRRQLPRGDRSLTNATLRTFDFPGFRASTQPAYPAIPSPTLPAATTTMPAEATSVPAD